MAVAEVRFADALTHEHQEQYHRNGFVKVPAAFSPEEVNELQEEADRLFQRTDLIDKWQNHVETGECRFDCFRPRALEIRVP